MSKIDLNDPRLTAYALNEMEPAERAEFEQVLAQDPAARGAVAEISATAAALTNALEHEPMEPEEKPAAQPDSYAKVIRFPYWTISSLAAACFAVFFIYWQRHEVFQPERQYVEVPLPPPATNTPEPATEAKPGPAPLEKDRANRDEMQTQVMARIANQAQVSSAKEQFIAARNEAIESAAKKTRMAVAPMPMSVATEAGDLATAGKSDSKEEVVTLSPFQVAVQDKIGSGTSLTLAGVSARTEQQASIVSIRRGRDPTDGLAEGKFGGSRQDYGYVSASNHPLSHIGSMVATASYAEVQRFLNEGRRPPPEAVRIEELVNHFSYSYAPPVGETPFSANLEVAGAPWAPTHRLVRIGLKARAAGDTTEGKARAEAVDGKLVIIARDVQIQVEFNPQEVQAYRLVGYENRPPAKEEPNRTRANIGVDGADQALTVLYEVVPVGVAMSGPDDTATYERLESARARSLVSTPTNMLTVEIRYTEPSGGPSRRLEFPLRDRGMVFEKASDDFKFAAAVASFGMMLRDSPFKGSATWGAVASWARDGLGNDAGGQRNEFLGLVERVRQMPQ